MHNPFEIIQGSNYMNAADYTYTMTIDILYQSFKGLYNVAVSQNSLYLNAVVLNNDLVEQSKIFMDYLSKLTVLMYLIYDTLVLYTYQNKPAIERCKSFEQQLPNFVNYYTNLVTVLVNFAHEKLIPKYHQKVPKFVQAKNLSAIVESTLPFDFSNQTFFQQTQMFLIFSQSMMLHSGHIIELFGYPGLQSYTNMIINKMAILFPWLNGFTMMWHEIINEMFLNLFDPTVHISHSDKNMVMRCNRYHVLQETLSHIYDTEFPKTLILVEKPLIAYMLYEMLRIDMITNKSGVKVETSLYSYWDSSSEQSYITVPETRKDHNLHVFYAELNKIVNGTHLLNLSEDQLEQNYQDFQNCSKGAIFVSTEFNSDFIMEPTDKILIFDDQKFHQVCLSPLVLTQQIQVLFVRNQREEIKRKIKKIDKIMKQAHEKTYPAHKLISNDSRYGFDVSNFWILS